MTNRTTHLLSRKRRGAVANPLHLVLQTTQDAGFAEVAERGGSTEKAHHGHLAVEFMFPCWPTSNKTQKPLALGNISAMPCSKKQTFRSSCLFSTYNAPWKVLSRMLTERGWRRGQKPRPESLGSCEIRARYCLRRIRVNDCFSENRNG